MRFVIVFVSVYRDFRVYVGKIGFSIALHLGGAQRLFGKLESFEYLNNKQCTVIFYENTHRIYYKVLYEKENLQIFILVFPYINSVVLKQPRCIRKDKSAFVPRAACHRKR